MRIIAIVLLLGIIGCSGPADRPAQPSAAQDHAPVKPPSTNAPLSGITLGSKNYGDMSERIILVDTNRETPKTYYLYPGTLTDAPDGLPNLVGLEPDKVYYIKKDGTVEPAPRHVPSKAAADGDL